MILDRGFTAAGAIVLSGVGIGGNLRLQGASIGVDTQGRGLECQGARIGRDVWMSNAPDGTAFQSKGAVRFVAADIAGSVRCQGARLNSGAGDGDSLVCSGARIGGSVWLSNGFTSVGAVRFTRADITGSLACGGATLGANDQRNALIGDNMKVTRDVTLDLDRSGTRCTAAGAVLLTRAEISGSLVCGGAAIGADNEHNSLIGDGIRVSGDVFLGPDKQGTGFTAAGAVRFTGADIAGQLNCGGATLSRGDDAGGNALICNGVTVGRSVYLDRGFTSAGAVLFERATVAGSLNCRGADLKANKEGSTLVADRANVNGRVLLEDGFAADGAVNLRGAQISRELCYVPARAPAGTVNLEGAHAQYLTDDWSPGRPGGCWPQDSRLRLSGFTYEGFGGDRSAATVRQRLDWIGAQYRPAVSGTRSPDSSASSGAGDQSHPGDRPAASPPDKKAFAAQPYKQLAEVYRRNGQDDEARTVEITRRQDLRKLGDLSWGQRAWNWFLDKTIKYSFQTWRALIYLAILYGVVFAASVLAQQQPGLIVPANAAAAPPSANAQICHPSYPCFYPAGYAVDVVVPLINIFQAPYWRPNGDHAWGWAWVSGIWLATGLGWSFATLLVVGYSGLARRD